MPFEKIVEDKQLRYRWTGSTTLDGAWRFVELKNRRGTLYVRVDAKPWTYYKADGGAASSSQVNEVRGRGNGMRVVVRPKPSN